MRAAVPWAVTALLLQSCTGQLPGSFRYQQQLEKFSAFSEVNTRIDLLWVVDNSASMDVSQRKIRDGFSGFARRYLSPRWDIRLAAITTDTYLANPAFKSYRDSVIPGTVGYRSNHVMNRAIPFVNPASNPTLYNAATGSFPQGIRYGELVPSWNRNWSRLLPGSHDGPTTSLCVELLPYFLKGATLCPVRDAMDTARGLAIGNRPCTRPDAAAGESSITSCVNTMQNDSIHTGKPILSTQPWEDTLVDDFIVNVSVGSSGQGSERGLFSVLQLLADNEGTDTAFFRKGSLRVLVFVSDEDDQSMVLPSSPPVGFTPTSHYQCDSARLQELNPGAPSQASLQCPASGFRCPEKSIDGLTYRVSYCPRQEAPLLPVADFKSRLDAFFNELDGADSAGDSNYFVVGILPLTAASIQQLQSDRAMEDTSVGLLKQWAVDRGDRYLELVRSVANGSLALDIGEPDYAPAFDAIGRVIVEKKGTFLLARPAGASEDMLVWVEHSDGTRTQLLPSQFTASGTSLRITDMEVVLSLTSTDRVAIDYQPARL